MESFVEKYILAIDTSCDETSVALTRGTKILSNVLWSQASQHARFGGVYPSLAKRSHQEHIDWVIQKALKTSRLDFNNIDLIAVTVGPGLAVALEVGIAKAKELAKKHKKKIIPLNHTEGHLLSVFASSNRIGGGKLDKNELFPALALIASGKHTDLILVSAIGKYKIIASTIDDALGEALDKAARMLGLGYPGGAVLEKMAVNGNKDKYELPTPMLGKEDQFEFSYSGLKTAMWRLVEKETPLNRQKIYDLSATFQNKAFLHVERLTIKALLKHKVKTFIFGGGVSSNIELRKRLRKILKAQKIQLLVPYSKKLCTDNAAMIGIAASFKKNSLSGNKIDLVEREPRAMIGSSFKI